MNYGIIKNDGIYNPPAESWLYFWNDDDHETLRSKLVKIR